MRTNRLITLINVHAEGEVGRIVTGGILTIPGATMADKMRYMNAEGAALRRFLTSEPRASAQMSTNLLFAPTRPDADVAFLVLQLDKAHAMSGSNAMCVTTAVLETGIVPMTEPESIVRLDTPAGLVVARAHCRDGRCERVTLDMPPSFAAGLDLTVTTPSLGAIQGDLAFGGIFYFLVDAAQIGLRITPQTAKPLVDAGIEILACAQRDLEARHPENPALDGVSYVMFRDVDEAHPRPFLRNATIMWPGRVDRSPCGTGSSARAAVMMARGEANVGEKLVSRSISGGEFGVEIAGVGEVAGLPAILPRISGRAWIYGTQTLTLDPCDPFPEGFTLSDTWGPGLAG